MHFALNMVCSPEGAASGVLIRSGEIVDGAETAAARRTEKRGRAGGGPSGAPIPHHLLARGPGNLATALGIERPTHDGLDLLADPFAFEPATGRVTDIRTGPRVGVSGEAGGPAFPWRFWIAGDPTVSAYRPGRNVPRGV
jgi:DNA-3-methyladenine glycosylase